MIDDLNDPFYRLAVLRKAWPEAFGHINWLVSTCLRIRADMPNEKHKGCSGELNASAARTISKEVTP
jgi:hypothetical protein